MHYSLIDTPLGNMMAIADQDFLYALDFVEKENLEFAISRFGRRLNTSILPGSTPIIKKIGTELKDYFAGKKMDFNTPVHLTGSPFQKKVWEELKKIPSGEKFSYLDIARKVEKPNACRAVGTANGKNLLVLVIPCHRVINHNGELGGYGGGLDRKKWLLDHEKTYKQ